MASNIRLGFSRVDTLPELLVEGVLYFNSEDHQIHLKSGDSTISYGGSITNAVLEGAKLTISKSDGSSVVLDFSSLEKVTETLGASTAFSELKSAIDSASTPYTGSNAISVSDHAISLVINPSDKILSQTASGLQSNLSLTYDQATATIKLMGKDANTPISTIDLPLEQILKSASFDSETHELKLVFNASTGDQEVTVDLSDLVDTYTSGEGINISAGGQISVLVDPATEGFLTLSGTGLKLAGIQSALDGKLPTTATINGKSFVEGALTLGAADILVSKVIGTSSASDSVEKVLEDLSTRIDSVESGNVTAGNGISVSGTEVSIKLDSVKSDNILQVSADGAYVPSFTWSEF